MKFDTVLKDEQRVEGKRCMLSLHILLRSHHLFGNLPKIPVGQ